MQCRVIGPHLSTRGKSHGFYEVVAGTWAIFSSYGGHGHSKLVFFLRPEDSCLVMMDTSGIYTRLSRTIQMLLEVMKETDCSFLVCIVILRFLSIFKKCQATSPFEALNSACLTRSQGM